MTNEEETTLITAASSNQEILSNISKETSPAELDKAIQLYNLNMKKSNLIRAAKLSEIQDNLVNELILRSEVASELSNRDLIEIYKLAQSNVDSALNSEVNTASVVINQQQINVGSELSRESRKNITAAVNAILSKYEKPTLDDRTIIDTDDTLN